MAEERRITKQYLMEHLDENELDLSMINLSKVPVRELVRGVENAVCCGVQTHVCACVAISAGSNTSCDQVGPVSEPDHIPT
jgi:hypothetical protein